MQPPCNRFIWAIEMENNWCVHSVNGSHFHNEFLFRHCHSLRALDWVTFKFSYNADVQGFQGQLLLILEYCLEPEHTAHTINIIMSSSIMERSRFPWTTAYVQDTLLDTGASLMTEW